VRQLVQTTLLLAGLSLAVSSELRAEEVPEEEAQSSEQEPGQDPPEEEPTESLRPTGASDWEADLDAMIEEARPAAIDNLDVRDDELDSDDELNWRTSDESSGRQTLHGGRYVGSVLLAGVGFGAGHFMNGSKSRFDQSFEFWMHPSSPIRGTLLQGYGSNQVLTSRDKSKKPPKPYASTPSTTPE